MLYFKKTIALWTAFAIIAGWFHPVPARALTTKEEQELAVEFLKEVRRQFVVIDDPVIENYINHVGQKIVSNIPPQPFTYHFYMVREDSYNAFAGPAGNIFIHSGLFEDLDNEDELAGLLAHEIAHVSCRHISDIIEKAKVTNIATLAGVVAGILMGVGGAAAVGGAVTFGSMAAGQTAVLAYTREHEMQADQIGRTYLAKSGYDLSALLTVLKKIRAVEWADSKEIPTYLKTHPATEDRIIYLDTLLEDKPKPVLKPSYEFLRAKYRVTALYGNKENALKEFQNMLEQNPGDVMAQYGYGLTLERSGAPKTAIPYLKAALAAHPDDHYLVNDLGRVYFLSGDYDDAVKTLADSTSLKDGGPDGYLYLGQSQMELGKSQDAADTFNKLLTDYPDNTDALFFLGKALGQTGRLSQAHYSLGLYYLEKKDPKTAMFHLQKALELETDETQKNKIKTILDNIGKRRDWEPEPARK